MQETEPRTRQIFLATSRFELRLAASLTEEDFMQLGKCRRPHNRLGNASL